MKSAKYCLSTFIILLGFYACKKPGCTDIQAINFDSEATSDDNSCLYETNLSIEFVLKNNNLNFSKYDTLNFDGNRFRLEKLKFYLSNIHLDNNASDNYSKEVHLIDIDNPSSQTVSLIIPEGIYNNVNFGLGLNSTQNSTTPADYSVDHPMGLNQNTFWAMTPSSYIFIVLEGKMDTSTTTDFFPISYHLAHNDLFQELNFTKPISIDQSSTNQIFINLNIAQLFVDVDLSENLPHQSKASPLAIKLMSNFSNALEIE